MKNFLKKILKLKKISITLHIENFTEDLEKKILDTI